MSLPFSQKSSPECRDIVPDSNAPSPTGARIRRTNGSEHSYITTSVDDVLTALTSKQESESVINELASLFEITNNSEPSFHLGCGPLSPVIDKPAP